MSFTLSTDSLVKRIPAGLRVALLIAAQLLVLEGCGGVASLDPDAPAGVNFGGTWRLNPAASDDPRKVLERLRPQRQTASNTSGATNRSGRRRRGSQDPAQGPSQGVPQTPDDSSTGDLAMPRSAFSLVPNSDLLRNEVLAIKQRPDAFVLDYGTSVRRLTPGARSVVSVPTGVADQSTGWKGKDYVVDIRSQIGLNMTERYSLSDKNGKQLIVTVHLSGSGFPSVNLTRVYDPAGAELPRSFPTND